MYRFALSDRFSLSNVFLPLLAPPVPLHPFTKTDVVQRRNPHQKTGARAVHRVSINGPLQTQCFHTEKSEDQMCSKSHKGRKFRWLHGKANCQWFWYVGNVQLCDIILLQIQILNFFVIIHLLYFVFQESIATTTTNLFPMERVRLYFFTLLVWTHSSASPMTTGKLDYTTWLASSICQSADGFILNGLMSVLWPSVARSQSS